jgi:mRNA interferase HigB
MTIHLIRKDTIELYSIQNAQCRDAFEEWMSKLKNADWETSSDMKSTFPSVDLLGNGLSRAVFDIGGNKYRLIGKYAFGEKQVHLFICWIGSHAEYDKLCKMNDQYTINLY